MSTAKFSTWQNPDGTENYKCRAWVNFNGTGTVAIRGSGNVSSITDNGTGLYTINFTTAMPDANYAVGGMCTGVYNGGPINLSDTGGSDSVYAQTSSAVYVETRGNGTSNALYDAIGVEVMIFR